MWRVLCLQIMCCFLIFQLHSVWYDIDAGAKPSQHDSQSKLSDSLTSAVDSLKSITSLAVKKDDNPV